MISINVQRCLSGAEPFSIRLPAQATLQVLKSVIADRESLDFIPSSGVSWSLVLGDCPLRDEYDLGNSRWKCLADYGMKDGTLLGLVKHAWPGDSMINIVVKLLDQDHGFMEGWSMPLRMCAGATLADVEQSIYQSTGLSSEDWVLSLSLKGEPPAIAANAAGPRWASLAEHGLEGTTLGLRVEPKAQQKLLQDISNLQSVTMSELFRSCSNAAQKRNLLASTAVAQQSSRHCPGWAGHCCSSSEVEGSLECGHTPTRQKLAIDKIPSPCKAKRSNVRTNKMLKRL